MAEENRFNRKEGKKGKEKKCQKKLKHKRSLGFMITSASMKKVKYA